jgi:dipeptidyl-peptidase-4
MRFHPLFTACFILILAFSAPVSAQKAITIDDVFLYFKFYPQSSAGYHYLRDGVHYVRGDKKGIHVYDVRRADHDSLIALKLPEEALEFDHFEFSKDETRLMLRSHTEPVYRHSVLGDYHVYDLQTQSTLPLNPGKKTQFAALSPDGAKAAFVAGNNLFTTNLVTGQTVQITSDGQPNQIINGLPDWVYEEEFSTVDGAGMVATVWSPDSRSVAYLRFDERQVPEFPLTWYEGGMYPRRTRFKYPKVGERNSVVTAHVYDLQTGRSWQADTGPETDLYLPRLHWTRDNRLVVSRLNRHQDTLDLLLFAPPAGPATLAAPTLLLRETDPAYVEIEKENKLIFLEDGKHFTWMSESSGFTHLYLYDLQGRLVRPLTAGAFEVTSFYGIDEKNGRFYYQTATPTALDRQVWEGSLTQADAPRLMTPGPGAHEASFSPTFDYYLLTRSDANTPPVTSLFQRSGALVRTLVDNQRIRRMRQEYGFVDKEFFTFKTSDGVELNGWMLKPAVPAAGRRYPVLFDIYGGPGSQTVLNQYDGFVGAWHQMLVQQGYIVVSVDNRGTGGRGRAFKKATHRQLGRLETADQIAAARYLGAQTYVDSTRIGIWGWSFGGYLSTSCILKGAEVFKMAMAVAPVTNWKWYDTAYTERYMHTTADNAAGYEQNSPVNFAGLLRGDNYLLCHGMADDNVHWQQSVEMVNALIAANKPFDTYYYPNRNHGIAGENATRHLFTKLTEFLREKL